ncbi:YceI family protein [Hymenobacter psychrotolerans]|uniref:Polyisoprenoid-binding protein YceI n=1 Tax=Hymenobacter psychrotolerans DSM 18569 TaxID=1121959 RepID=A0A1M7B226_9BACT|nr:YceI family protein [Hymenobacter psychrotolerans]SHL48957.1 Polyisoprenoid-binding protein YceI [Hymenobacter psychrotolerans DSM 18569]
MKKILVPALLAVSLLAAPVYAGNPAAAKAASTQKAADKTYKVQPQLSTLGWVGKKVTGQHDGNVQFKDGSVLVRGNQIVGGTFVVDMNTLKVTDIKDADTNGKLVGHLRSEDFFSIDKNPTSTFKITKVTPLKKADAAGNNATITGDLTIKGITQSITFPAKTGVKGGLASASGTATIDRTKFDIKYGSKSFFEGIGDKAIYDDFSLSFNVVAKQ